MENWKFEKKVFVDTLMKFESSDKIEVNIISCLTFFRSFMNKWRDNVIEIGDCLTPSWMEKLRNSIEES